jgi:uncharacterized damage-inducible protein DinB
MATIGELLKELDREAPTTRRVLERVPVDKLAWKPHEKSQSMGQLALHVATIPGRISELAMQRELDVGFVVPRPAAMSMDELLGAHAASITRAHEIIGGMKDADLELPWKMVAGGVTLNEMTRGDVLRTVLFNHWYHHRGQLSVYLRETGALVPSIYGASADEAPFRR